MFLGDPESILFIEGLNFMDNLFYEEVSDQFFYIQVKKLRNKEAVSVNMLWKNHIVKDATWEAETDMKSRYLTMIIKTFQFNIIPPYQS